jgi:hypothetical protein
VSETSTPTWDAHLGARQRADAGGQRPRGRVGVDREQEHGALGGVGRVDAGRGADDAEPVLDDALDRVAGAARRDDANGLVGDRLLAVVGADETPLGLRDHLRRDDEDVAVAQRLGHGGDDEPGEVGPRRDLG